MWDKLKRLDRKLVMGVIFLITLAGLIYFSGKSQRQIAVTIKPMTVHLNFSDHVKKRLAETQAVLGVQAIVSDKEVTTSPLEATVLDHREQIVKPGNDQARFEAKTLDVELPNAAMALDPTVSFSVISRFETPAGNCIHCESPMLKASSLKDGDNRIELQCNGWLEIGVCVWPKQNQK
jgi:hypothetical protein